MKTTRPNRMTSTAMMVLGLGLILISVGTHTSRQAAAEDPDAFTPDGDPKPNQMCIDTDPELNCGECPDATNICSTVLADYLTEGFCEPTSGSQGMICQEGSWDCGFIVDCDTRQTIDATCVPLSSLCRDDL